MTNPRSDEPRSDEPRSRRDEPRSRARSRTPQMARCMHKDRLGDKIDVVLRSLKEVPRRVGRGAVFNCCLINSN